MSPAKKRPAPKPRKKAGPASKRAEEKKPSAPRRAEAPVTPPAPEISAEDVDSGPPPSSEAFTPPEIEFTTRVPAPAPDRPKPARRRAIFIDVENTSRAIRVTEALHALAIDHADASTDIIASGNWRVIGNETARLLAQRGAHLVHSAPATGVRDWSDLRIAVAAGVWLASARLL